MKHLFHFVKDAMRLYDSVVANLAIMRENVYRTTAIYLAITGQRSGVIEIRRDASSSCRGPNTRPCLSAYRLYIPLDVHILWCLLQNEKNKCLTPISKYI